MSNQLLPCPFCGSDDLYQSTNGVDSYFVGCHQCGAEGPVVLSAVLSGKDDAAAEWNRRATQPAAGEPVYQIEKRDMWEDVSEEQQARCKEFGYQVRTLWTAPPAAAHGASEEHRNQMADTIVSLRTEIAALRRNAAAHGDEAVLWELLEALRTATDRQALSGEFIRVMWEAGCDWINARAAMRAQGDGGNGDA